MWKQKAEWHARCFCATPTVTSIFLLKSKWINLTFDHNTIQMHTRNFQLLSLQLLSAAGFLLYLLGNFIYLAVLNLRPVPTKWETSSKILFDIYKQIHDVQTLSFTMIYKLPGLLPYLGSKTHCFLERLLCFLLIFEMLNEPYLL